MAQPSPAAKKFFGDSKPLAIAHRGGDAAGFAKRNTMAAFQSAYDLGYRYFETDVIDSKDSKVVIAHGAKTWLIAKLRGTYSFHTLQSLSFEDINDSLKVGDETIPLLIEVMEAFPKARFLVDPKTDAVVEPLAKLIKENELYSRVAVGSFHPARTQALANMVGENKLCTIMIIDRLGGLLRLDFKLFRQVLKRARLFNNSKSSAFSVHYWLINRKLVAEAHREGKFVVAWTPNSRRDISKAITQGVDGIISDRVVLLKELVESKKDPSGS